MRKIIDTHYEYRVSRNQHRKLNEEYYFIVRSLADAPWWKRFWVFARMVDRIRNGKIL